MGDLIAVVPLYKADLGIAEAVAGEVFAHTGLSVFFDLVRPRRGDLSVQGLIDIAAARGVDAAADHVVALSAAGRVTVTGGGTSELAGRGEAAGVLVEIARRVAHRTPGCVALTPWWTAPEAVDSPTYRKLLEGCTAAVGVLEAPLADVVDTGVRSLEAEMARELRDATGGDTVYVVRGGEDPGHGLVVPLDDMSRTVVIADAAEVRSYPAGERLAELLGYTFPEDRRPPATVDEAMQRSGLPGVFVPGEFAVTLRSLTGGDVAANYAFGTTPFDPMAAYRFRPTVDAILDGDWEPRLQISAAGHGINSYAHCYTLVQKGLAVVAQIGFGALTDPERMAAQWGRLMAQVEQLHDKIRREPLPDDEMLLVAFSDIRDMRVGRLHWDQTRDQRREALASVDDPFSSAEAMLEMSAGTERPSSPAGTGDNVSGLGALLTLSARVRVADMWDHVLAEWMDGREIWREPEYEGLGRWFTSYTGAVDLDFYPDPYVGDLRGDHQPPRLVVLGLNPGKAYPDLQARGGLWAEGVRQYGYSNYNDRIPVGNPDWTALHGKDSPYWLKLTYFARRWCRDADLSPHEILNMELYPWHSDRVEGAIRPPADVLARYVWDPLAEVDVPVVFAFGKPWLAAAQALNLPREAWWGDHPDAGAALSLKHWNVVAFRLPTQQLLVVSWQPGANAPPGAERVEEMRRAFADLGVPSG